MGLIPGQEDSLEEGMATHFSILAWRILLTEEPGRLPSRGCKEWETTEAPKQSTSLKALSSSAVTLRVRANLSVWRRQFSP